MNVITVMSDEHSYQMMQFVNRSVVQTPNLDRLAAQSVVFDNCYSPCPVCAPARAAFFSGQFVNRIGTWDNSTPYDGSVPGISHQLQRYGKGFTCIGKTHFHFQGSYGFEHEELAGYMRRGDIGCFFRDERVGRVNAEKRYEQVSISNEESYDDRVLNAALNWLRANALRQDFMLYIGFLDPHFPFKVKQEHWDYYSSRITELPAALKPPFTSLNEPLGWLRDYFKCDLADEAATLRLLIAYHCAVTELDERLGVLMDELDRLGLSERTAMLYTSDHGEQLGYHGLWWKCCMFEQSAHVPLLARIPGVDPRRVEQPVNLVDIFPTVCDLMELPRPDNISGESLMGLARNGADELRRDFTFGEYHAHGVPRGMFMIRWREWKYVYYCGYEPQLFNLSEDPAEDNDRYPQHGNDPHVAKAVRECHRRLLECCDPYEVDERARAFQRRTRESMGITGYDSDFVSVVPHPQSVI